MHALTAPSVPRTLAACGTSILGRLVPELGVCRREMVSMRLDGDVCSLSSLRFSTHCLHTVV